MKNLCLELDYEVADNLVAQILLDHYEDIKKDKDIILNKEELEEYESLDLAHNIRYLEAFKIVLEYFGKYDET